jgi:hypothetical protein
VSEIAGSAVRVRGPVPLVEQGEFPPLAPDHPLVRGEQTCAACDRRFWPDQRVVLIALGPGADPEARERARADRWYSSEALVVHRVCATGEE